jgi:hypothetical protein
MLEKKAYTEWLIENKDDVFYITMKFLADYINDNPKATNRHLVSKVNKILAGYGQLSFCNSQVNTLVDFIRDSYIIYNDTIKGT